MCIIFMYRNNAGDGEYKLILAANRDEYFNRPTKPADFHPTYPHVVCGIDMQEGVEGGTWLGVSRTGKFSALTNVLVPELDETKEARGKLVIEYLSGDKSPMEYLQPLRNEDRREYNLLVGKITSDGKVDTAFYSNCDGAEPRVLSDKTTVISCTRLDGNWRKMQHGGKKFEEILSESKDLDHQNLTQILLDSLLSDTTTLFPDPNVKAQSKAWMNDEMLSKYCSVKIVGFPIYGTRMQTVLLIDKNNVIHFTERTIGPDVSSSSKYHTFRVQ